MHQENEPQPMILTLIRALFTIKFSKKSTSTCYLGIVILINTLGVIIGAIFLSLPSNKEIIISSYNNIDHCKYSSSKQCEVSFIVDEDLEAPVYIYYQLQNFIANSKDYITSKSRKQLYGHPITIKQAKNCIPYVTNYQMEVTQSWGGFPLDPNAVASPCGLQAKLYFRDTFELVSPGNKTIPLRTSGLLSMFMREPSSEQLQWIDPTKDSFEVWMTTSVSPVLEKIYGVINQTIPKGNYTFRIQNIMSYGINVEKNVLLYKERNEIGNSKLIGCLVLGGSLILFMLITLYTCCLENSCRCKN